MLVVENQPQNQEEGEGPKNFSINQGSFGEIFKTGVKPMQHHKPLQEFYKPIS